MSEMWYTTSVVWATGRPYRSGTGHGERRSCRRSPVPHPAIAQIALRNGKHDVQMKYWSYFVRKNGMLASCASLRGAISYPCILSQA